MNKIIKGIIDVIFIVLLVILVGYIVLRYTNKVEIYKVQTGSMEDGIHVGDYILIHKTNNYKIGDVITFKKGDNFVTHRIVSKIGDKIITKGDANNIEDDAISINDVVGKLILKGGILNFVINYKYAIASFMLSFYLITFILDKRENDKDEEELLEEKSDENEEKIEKIIEEEKKEKIEEEIEITEEVDEKKEKEKIINEKKPRTSSKRVKKETIEEKKPKTTSKRIPKEQKEYNDTEKVPDKRRKK